MRNFQNKRLIKYTLVAFSLYLIMQIVSYGVAATEVSGNTRSTHSQIGVPVFLEIHRHSADDSPATQTTTVHWWHLAGMITLGLFLSFTLADLITSIKSWIGSPPWKNKTVIYIALIWAIITIVIGKKFFNAPVAWHIFALFSTWGLWRLVERFAYKFKIELLAKPLAACCVWAVAHCLWLLFVVSLTYPWTTEITANNLTRELSFHRMPTPDAQDAQQNEMIVEGWNGLPSAQSHTDLGRNAVIFTWVVKNIWGHEMWNRQLIAERTVGLGDKWIIAKPGIGTISTASGTQEQVDIQPFGLMGKWSCTTWQYAAFAKLEAIDPAAGQWKMIATFYRHHDYIGSYASKNNVIEIRPLNKIQPSTTSIAKK